MLVLLFLLLLISLVWQYFRPSRFGILLITVTLVIAAVWFSHHVTSRLNIQL